MRIGMIGLGRMGANMVRRLQRGGHQVVAFDRSREAVAALAGEGAEGATSATDLVARLPAPRAIWLMVPAAAVDAAIAEIQPLLSAGDVLVDGGNSSHVDDLRRSAALAAKGVHFVDVGTSGGVFGLERGYCLMVGGAPAAVERLAPALATLAPPRDAAPRTRGRGERAGTAEHGWLHCGPSGAGHFVKMVHNGIEYGIMASYAEGLSILAAAGAGREARAHDAETAPLRDPSHYQYELDVPEISELWRRGSVVSSWLLDLTAEALAARPDLSGFAGRVADSGEGRWTVQAAVDVGVPAPVLTAALYQRFSSRGASSYADRILSAMRAAFGGHAERP